MNQTSIDNKTFSRARHIRDELFDKYQEIIYPEVNTKEIEIKNNKINYSLNITFFGDKEFFDSFPSVYKELKINKFFVPEKNKKCECY